MKRIQNCKVRYFTVLLLFLIISFCILLITSPIKVHSKTEKFSCFELFKKNKNQYLIEAYNEWINPSRGDSLLKMEAQYDCDNYLKNRKYFLSLPYDNEEKQFKIAFSILVFKSAAQVERLLRAIYRPWNYYCIHVDLKSSSVFFQTIEELINCLNWKYNNIINTANRVDVQWGKMSVLTADLNCMKELYERYKDWKYLINLTGQEFPLKTNAELVKILKAFKGANNLEGTYTRRNEDRVPTIKMPFPIVWYKGSVHITANRDFFKFIFESPKSEIILKALNNRNVPDEQFFSTLNHNANFRIPGSFVGNPDEEAPKTDPLKHFITRYKNWGDYPCESGVIVRGICIWGFNDLYTLIRVPHLFANKFYEDFQPITLHCLEQWYDEKVENESLTHQVPINDTFYSSLPFVKYRYIPPEL